MRSLFLVCPVGALVIAALVSGCSSTGPATTAPMATTTTALPTGEQHQTATAGNSTFVSTTTKYDPETGEQTVTSTQISIGTPMAGGVSAQGNWTIADKFARSCAVTLGGQGLAGVSGAQQATRTGYCTYDFDGLAGWRMVGADLYLLDASGASLGIFAADGKGGYAGSYQSRFGAIAVAMTRS